MPELSRFFGIVIALYYNDHPPPHFHARYEGNEAKYDIRTLTKIAGWLPPRAEALVLEWATLHRAELTENWRRAEEDQPLVKIEPLN